MITSVVDQPRGEVERFKADGRDDHDCGDLMMPGVVEQERVIVALEKIHASLKLISSGLENCGGGWSYNVIKNICLLNDEIGREVATLKMLRGDS